VRIDAACVSNECSNITKRSKMSGFYENSKQSNLSMTSASSDWKETNRSIYTHTRTDKSGPYLGITVAEWSKAWVCSRSTAEIAGSSTGGGMDIFLL
jgi:hypothetical protein